MIVVPDVSLELQMRWLLGVESPPADVVYRFFTNDVEPDKATVLADFTEADGGLIAPHTVNVSDWATEAEDGIATAETGQQTLTVTGPGSLYGYFVTNVANDALYWCERFTLAPYNYPDGEWPLKLTPRRTLRDVAAV